MIVYMGYEIIKNRREKSSYNEFSGTGAKMVELPIYIYLYISIYIAIYIDISLYISIYLYI